jgi:hypothetical protein
VSLASIAVKTRADYQAQANNPFDHAARMKDLLARQAKFNAALDLDKNENKSRRRRRTTSGLRVIFPVVRQSFQESSGIPLRA